MNTGPSSPPRAAIYARISQDRNGEGLGVERQLQACRQLAEAAGSNVVVELVDNDTSAYQSRVRTGYSDLLTRIGNDEIDLVYVWHNDRLHRSSKELLDYIELCARHGNVVTRTISGSTIDPSDPNSSFLATILGAVAQQESAHKANRTKFKQLESARTGRWIGGTRPFGWRLVAPGELEIEEAEASLIRRAAEDFLIHKNTSRILRMFEEENAVTAYAGSTWGGRPASGKWSYATIKQMLLRPRNAGIITYGTDENGKPVEVARRPDLAILSEETWRAIVTLLNDPARKVSARHGNKNKYLLSGIAECHCGGLLGSAQVLDSKGQKRMIYKCRSTGPTRDRKVKHASRGMTDLDALVIENLEFFIDAQSAYSIGDPESAATSRRVTAEIEMLKTRQMEAAEAFSEGLLDVAAYRLAVQAIAPKIDQLEKQLGELDASPVIDLTEVFPAGLPPAGYHTTESRMMLVRSFHAKDLHERRQIIRSVYERIIVHPHGAGTRREFDPTTIEFSARRMTPAAEAKFGNGAMAQPQEVVAANKLWYRSKGAESFFDPNFQIDQHEDEADE